MATAPTPAFRKIGHVTRQLIKLVKDQPYYLRFDSAIAIGKEIAGGRPDPVTGEVKRKEPAHVAMVTRMIPGEDGGVVYTEGQIIVSTVLRKELQENFPGDSYVGRAFEIVMHKTDQKDYNIFDISEVEVPEDAPLTLDAQKRRDEARKQNAQAQSSMEAEGGAAQPTKTTTGTKKK